MKPETVTFTQTVEIADSNGEAIIEGSVLQSTEDDARGVVMQIKRPGSRGSFLDQIGDLHIQTSPGSTRVTNRYDKWLHIPRNAQTYEERFLSWLARPYDHDEDRQVSPDTGLAIDGIMALLPDDLVDWDYGPWPDTLEDALRFLWHHLQNPKE